MSREVRRVPAIWEHPKRVDGKYIPLLEADPEDPPEESDRHMPNWPVSERTHYQMYETTTEGKPISPVCETPEELARWLADNKASAFAGMPANYDHWLSMINNGSWAPTAFRRGGVMISGVEAMFPSKR
ncbi:MAG: hypothetical protein JWL88_11 [Parcubacteria group bacterium]|nr:hypothetical protein [Parcubacteria group bacterium]